MRLYDQSGAPVDVPDDQATSAIASGKYGLPASQPIHLATEDEDGEQSIKAVPFGEAAQHVASGKATVATPEQVRKADLEARYGGVGGALEAGAEGAVSGATLGLSDLAAAKLGGDDVRQRLADVKEIHPYARGAGEVLGAVGPALATGGASEVVSAGELGLQAANAAEHAGQAGSLLRSAGRVLAAPVEAVGQVGGAFERGVGELVGSDATSLATRIGQGAAKTAARGAAEGALYGGGQELSEQSLGSAPLNGEKLLAAVGHGALLGGLGGAGLGAAGEVGSEVMGRLARKVSLTAEDRAAAAVSGGAKIEDARAVGRELLDRNVVRAGDTIEDIAARVGSEKTKVGTQVAKLLDAADAAEVAAPDLSKATAKLAAMGIDTAQLVPTQLAGGFRQATEMRSALDGIIAKGGEGTSGLRAARALVDDEIQRSIPAAAKQLGSDWRKSVTDAETSLANLGKAEQAAASNIAKRAAAKASPELHAMAVGSGVLALLHGASPLSLAGGLATTLAHRYVQERAPSTAAVMLDRIGQLGAVRRAAARMDQRIATGVAEATSPSRGARIAVKAAKKAASTESYAEKRKLVTDAASDPQAHRDAIDTAIGPLVAHAPETAAAFKSAAIRSTSYLASQLPPHPAPTSLLPVKPDAYEPPPELQAAFVRKYDAVHDPVSVLAHASAGTLTQDQVDAVETTHPELLHQMRTDALSKLGDLPPGTSLPQEAKEGLTVLLGTPVDATTSPAFVQTCQQEYAASSAPKSPGPAGKPGRKTGNGAQGKGAPRREIKAASLSSLSNPYGASRG